MIQNRYEINGNDVLIYLNSVKHGEQVCIVSKISFEQIIKPLSLRWYAQYSPSCDTYYVVSWDSGNQKTRKRLHIHRLICNLTIKDSALFPDHLNHDGLDNRIENLTVKTRSDNKHNMNGLYSNNKSGYRNVFFAPERGTYRIYFRIRLNTIRGEFRKRKDAILFASELQQKFTVKCL